MMSSRCTTYLRKSCSFLSLSSSKRTFHSLLWILCIGVLSVSSLTFASSSSRGRRWSNTSQRSLRQVIRLSCQNEGAWLSLARYKALNFKLRQRSGPHNARVGEAHYKARHTAQGLHIQATVHIEAQGPGWHRLPILPIQYPVLSATLNGQKAWLIHPAYQYGYRQLVFKGSGRFTLNIRFFLARAAGPDPSARLQLIPAMASHIQVRFEGKGFRPKLSSGLDIRTKHHPTYTELKAILGPKQHPTLSWWRATQAQTTKKSKKRRTARMYARTYALLSAGRAGQELFVLVRYTIVHASREQFRLRIPPGIRIRRVHGLGIRDYRIKPAPKGKGSILDVLLMEPVTERYELSLLTENRALTTNHPAKAGAVQLRLPEPLGVQRETGFLGVEVIGNDALTIHSKGSTAIDVQELPNEIKSDTQRPILRAFRFTKRPAEWSIKIHKHANVSVPAALIDKALYLHVVNPTGHTWVQASYQVRNTFKQFIAIQLPQNARLQSAFVGGKPVKPARDAKGRVLVPLKRSGKSAGHAFTVEVVYSLNERKYTGRSVHDSTLPSVDLWISSQQWNLYIPEGAANWENPQLGEQGPRGYSRWRRTRLSDIARPRRYKKTRPSKWSRSRSYTQRVQGNSIILQQGGQNAGTLPVRVQLPRNGKRYTLYRYHLPPYTSTTLQFVHQTPYFGAFGLALFLLGGCLFGFALTWMRTGDRWGAWLPWLILCASCIVLYAGYTFSTFVHGTYGTFGALVGVLLGGFLNFFLSWKKPSTSAQTVE